jgi:hypothetical protein
MHPKETPRLKNIISHHGENSENVIEGDASPRDISYGKLVYSKETLSVD